MARIEVGVDGIEIRLSAWEKIAGLLRDRSIPRSAITQVSVEQDALAALRGLRAPGLSLPGRLKIGTWRGGGRRAFVCARRSVPAVRIETTGLDRDVFLVSVPDADDVVRRLGG